MAKHRVRYAENPAVGAFPGFVIHPNPSATMATSTATANPSKRRGKSTAKPKGQRRYPAKSTSTRSKSTRRRRNPSAVAQSFSKKNVTEGLKMAAATFAGERVGSAIAERVNIGEGMVNTAVKVAVPILVGVLAIRNKNTLVKAGAVGMMLSGVKTAVTQALPALTNAASSIMPGLIPGGSDEALTLTTSETAGYFPYLSQPQYPVRQSLGVVV